MFGDSFLNGNGFGISGFKYIHGRELFFTVSKSHLRTQPLHLPLIIFPIPPLLALIDEPIVKTALPTLPKLHPRRHDAQASPELRHGNLVFPFKRLLRLGHPLLQLGPPVIPLALGLQHLTLSAGPGPDPAPPHPRIKIGLTLLPGVPRRDALDAHLSLQGAPVEDEGSMRIRRQVSCLAGGAEVGVDDVAALGVELLEVDDAGGDAAGGQLGRGQGACFGLREARSLRLGEPCVELGGRGGEQLRSGEGGLCELFGLAVGGGSCWGDFLYYVILVLILISVFHFIFDV